MRSPNIYREQKTLSNYYVHVLVIVINYNYYQT